MAAEDPTLIAGSLTLAEAQAVVDANDTIVDAGLAEEMRSLSRSLFPVALPSLPPPLPPVTDATHYAFVGAALAAAAFFVGVVSLPQLMVRRDRTWVTPATLTASDARVVEVAEALAATKRERTQLEEEQDRLTARVDELEALESPPDYEATLRSELVRRRAEAKKLQTTIDERDRSYIPPSSELGAKLKTAEQQIKALKAARRDLLADASRAAEKQEHRSRLASIRAALDANDQQRALLDALPYRAAVDGDVVLAFVPTENNDHVQPGMTLSACRWGTLLCTGVGTVKQAFELEVDGTNPIGGQAARGHFVAVTWTEPAAARPRMLFAR